MRIKTCPTCKNKFTVNKQKGNYLNIYCGQKCFHNRNKNRKKPKTRLCKGCNTAKPFTSKYFGPRIHKRYSFGLATRCKDCCNKEAKEKNPKHRIKLRIDILTAYSNGKLICACCGEKHIEFLTLDHTNGNGCIQRREMSQVRLFTKLRRNKYPDKDEYRVLCMNCNFSYGIRGYCPHQRKGIH